MRVGDVWLNGKKVASTECGYLGFEVDVTEKLKPSGGVN
jgi:beta-galactosidase